MEHSAVLMVARTIAANPELFTTTLLSTYFSQLAKLLLLHNLQDTECALSALSIALRQKKILGCFKDQHELIDQWLACAKSTLGEVKVAFMVSVEGLLERTEGADEYAKFMYWVLGRMFGGESLAEFLKYLEKFLVDPFPQETLVALRVLQGTSPITHCSFVGMGLGSEGGIKECGDSEVLDHTQADHKRNLRGEVRHHKADAPKRRAQILHRPFNCEAAGGILRGRGVWREDKDRNAACVRN
eukprot:TRINITY_DN3098_c0_g3_i4.p1 TRINITY_DN3098_c0_g3~~TRINITY_DN3098_c0_g3_i4.p1  ORF type:complete len:243 (+),score=31.30 TRINITY_DN3098_c0_g3_i4:984-1712(+)